ncbi:unnamed protein product [Wickerhamomyces anomalus]
MAPKGKKVAPAPLAGSKVTKAKGSKNPLAESKPKKFGIGQNIQPKRNLSRFVKWPEYVRLQRQRKVLSMRLKVPPAIAQFQHTLDRNTAAQAFKLFNKYRPETAAQKKERLTKEAAAIAEGKSKQDASPKPFVVKYGLNHPLCRKLGVPYAIVKGKARLGTLVHLKTAAVAALTEVKPEDEASLATLVSTVTANFNDKFEENRKHWGGHILGAKSQAKAAKRARASEKA